MGANAKCKDILFQRGGISDRGVNARLAVVIKQQLRYAEDLALCGTRALFHK